MYYIKKNKLIKFSVEKNYLIKELKVDLIAQKKIIRNSQKYSGKKKIRLKYPKKQKNTG